MEFQADKILESTLSNIDRGSFRFQILEIAQRFKSNWVELGELLTRVATQKLYTEWGYKNFEEYCRVEIKIKRHTAIKLTNAWFFLNEEEPGVVQNQEGRAVPDLDAVGVLHKAHENKQWTPEMYAKLRESAFEKQESGTGLARMYRDMNKEHGIGMEDPLKKSLQMVVKLRSALREIGSDISAKHFEELDSLESVLNELSS